MAKTCRSDDPLERDWQVDALNYLESIGGHWIKLSASAYQKAGEPDIIGCFQGKFYALELKKKKSGRASALQKYKIQLIKDNGGVSMFIKDLTTLKGLFPNERS